MVRLIDLVDCSTLKASEDIVANDNLIKWRSLLSQLDLCLGSLGDFKPQIYPHRVSTLNEDELVDFALRTREIWPKGSLPTLTEDQLQKFESQADLILPQGYREFCQIFGSGQFGWDGFFIDSPDIDEIEKQLGSDRCIFEACKGNLEAYKGNYYSSQSNEIDELLDNAYLFGGGSGLIAFVFDLRTYNEQDLSYDIYGINCDSDFVCYLGRDFFEFVRDICMGDRAKQEFPELLLGSSLDFDENNLFYRNTTFFLSRSPSSIREDKDLEEWEIEQEEEDEDLEADYWLTRSESDWL